MTLRETNKAITHVELRPMKDVGDIWAATFMGDAEYYNVYYATASTPAIWDKSFEDINEAFEYLKSPAFVNVKCWYNGYEAMEEIETKEDIILALCASEFHAAESMVEFGEDLGLTESETEALIAVHEQKPRRPPSTE